MTIYSSGKYLENNPHWHEEDAPWKVGHIERMIARHSLNFTTVCDVGCGTGAILKLLHDRLSSDIRYTGLDVSPQAIERAQAKATPRLAYVQSEQPAEALPESDLALAIDVFEHVEDYYAFLRSMRDKSRHQIFHIPLDISVNKVFFRRLNNRRTIFGHIHYFTKETALASLKHAGLEVVDWFYTHSTADFSGEGVGASILKLPRKLFFALMPDLTVTVLGGFSMLVLTRNPKK